MQLFFRKTLLFLIPLLLLFVGVEYLLRNLPNAFISKSEYFKNNVKEINTLVLGTSHSQLSVNPRYFKSKTTNIAYNAQDFGTDLSLFYHYIPKMNNLKTVLVEYGYQRMDLDNPPDYFRFPWYYLFYDVEVKPLKLQNKFSLYFSNPAFFSNILRSYFKNEPPLIINQYGFVEENDLDDFKNLKYNEAEVLRSAPERLEIKHKEIDPVAFEKNAAILKKMILYCQKNKIRLVFFSSPFYQTYLDAEMVGKKKKVQNFMVELQKIYGVEYYDFSEDKDFKLVDFRDDNHLNAQGARKFSYILDGIIK